jgi:hypothetical protein
MSEQEQQAALRAELLAGIQGALSGPGVPDAPKPLRPDASPAEKAAFEAAQRDHGIHVSLSKSTGDLSRDEGDQLRAAVLKAMRDAEKGGW